MNASDPLRAPEGAVAWSPMHGWIYGPAAAADAVDNAALMLVVSNDGLIHGVQATDRAPLAATIRADGELVDVRRWHAVLAAKVADLQAKVAALEDRAAGHDTGDAIELVAIKARLRRLEEDRG